MAKKTRPLVFVPGLFGSMSDVIAEGTGDWSFGISKFIYAPFVRMLESMGYKLNEDLFIAFYDWRKPCDYTAKVYLDSIIEKAKKHTKSDKVNIISHSMGGLVARAYVQSNYYMEDVDQLIQIATPNSGSAPNYSFWAGGGLPDQDDLEFSFVRVYMDIYLRIIGMEYENKIEGIHTAFKGLNDILPSYSYGDYLYYTHKDYSRFKSIKEMKTKNTFLNDLNATQREIKQSGIKLSIIAATGQKTIEFLEITDEHKWNIWIDGKAIDFTLSNDGDGNAMVRSVFSIDGDKYLIEGSHITVLYRSEPILSGLLK